MGPFALVQRPPPAVLAARGLSSVAKSTVVSKRAPDESALSLIMEFDELVVFTLPPMRTEDELSVGRLPTCDITLDDPSVSKQHAQLNWDDSARRCTLRDLGSRNGTWIDGQKVHEGDVSLRDGDVVSFGDVDYWYLLTPTLHAKLQGLPERASR